MSLAMEAYARTLAAYNRHKSVINQRDEPPADRLMSASYRIDTAECLPDVVMRRDPQGSFTLVRCHFRPPWAWKDPNHSNRMTHPSGWEIEVIDGGPLDNGVRLADGLRVYAMP